MKRTRSKVRNSLAQRPIRIMQQSASSRNSVGDVVEGEPTAYVRFARRIDRGGKVAQNNLTDIAEWTTRYQVMAKGIEEIEPHKWWVVDSGRSYDIVSVSEVDELRDRFYLNCVART